MGKPVISPDELFSNCSTYYVCITAWDRYDEILGILRENHFPSDHILPYFECTRDPEYPHSYFDMAEEFSDLGHFTKGTAFIDGGCYDGADSLDFAKWCGGAYSKIIAFEPDPDNYQRCIQAAEQRSLKNFEVVQAGLSDRSGTSTFAAAGTGYSRIRDEIIENERKFTAHSLESATDISIATKTIDECAKNDVVGMIKMDIEGMEYNALHGAETTIRRDKPVLAICVYHRVGDMLAIMDYLHQLVPGYRFWLRHYGPGKAETVLYAVV